ncbi:uncharacterized protein LOC144108691 [Amblyomma americanum]
MAVLNTHKGLFAYNRLAFGITSAPALFQRRLESVLQGLPRVKVYMDDIIIAEKENDDSTLRQVFERLRDNGLKLNLDKCRFREKQVTFLGHKIDATGLHTPQNMEAITAAPRPETQLADLSRSDDKLQRIRGWISRGWSRHLSAAQQHLMPYFSRRNETTPLERGKSPAELLFGFSPRTRLTASLTDIKVTENDSGEPVPAVTKSPTRYQPGKPVWSRQFRSARKWMPATVVSTTGARMVTLETPEGSQRRHVDQLRPRLDVGSSPSKPSPVRTPDEAQSSSEEAEYHQGAGKVLPFGKLYRKMKARELSGSSASDSPPSDKRKSPRVCGRHFSPDDYCYNPEFVRRTGVNVKKLRLKPRALPALFLPTTKLIVFFQMHQYPSTASPPPSSGESGDPADGSLSSSSKFNAWFSNGLILYGSKPISVLICIMRCSR